MLSHFGARALRLRSLAAASQAARALAAAAAAPAVTTGSGAARRQQERSVHVRSSDSLPGGTLEDFILDWGLHLQQLDSMAAGELGVAEPGPSPSAAAACSARLLRSSTAAVADRLVKQVDAPASLSGFAPDTSLEEQQAAPGWEPPLSAPWALAGDQPHHQSWEEHLHLGHALGTAAEEQGQLSTLRAGSKLRLRLRHDLSREDFKLE